MSSNVCNHWLVANKPEQKARIQLNVTQALIKYYFTIMCLQPNREHGVISSLQRNELLPLACSVSLLSSGGKYLHFARPFKVVAVNSPQEKWTVPWLESPTLPSGLALWINRRKAGQPSKLIIIVLHLTSQKAKTKKKAKKSLIKEDDELHFALANKSRWMKVGLQVRSVQMSFLGICGGLFAIQLAYQDMLWLIVPMVCKTRLY